MDQLQLAFQILQTHHFKLTKQRRSLLAYLVQYSNYYIALSQLDQHLRATYPTMSHETIYRNVKEMQHLDIVETKMFNNGLRVKFQCDFTTKEHSHFICQLCGRATEIPLPDFHKALDQLKNAQIDSYHVEVLGICEHCQTKN
ncbi:transcriptional repressor [Bombilactobacillus folatiphilus]|uniref:Transcriptional repressor n=1 Tax=Bombilactobacillus folatiphilus TaxID=2923362 RepID=A0ABY4P8V9_9LACO|nr:transcriptional repressor [Bombilactobacillus folatiphilus]UQS81966.1 transcriptional repressor [Bombilactobacillus folatiphilus]